MPATDRKRARTITKADVVEQVRDVTGLGWAESGDLVEGVLDAMKESLANGENIKISGFGSFIVRTKQERRGRNPQTAASIMIPRRRVLTFKPSQVLRQSLNDGLES
jgi:integration host factor subunit alpha